MSITSGQDTDSRQFTLAANSHRLAGETYDANGNRTSGSADGFTSVSYNILNLPETVTAGGWTINYLYSAAGVKLRERVILSDPPCHSERQRRIHHGLRRQHCFQGQLPSQGPYREWLPGDHRQPADAAVPSWISFLHH